MANKKISALTSASALTGVEELAIVQTATTKKVDVDTIKDYAELSAISVTTSRDFANTDIGKCLIIENAAITLTMPTTGINSNFNCTIKPLTGYDGILAGAVTYDAPNGLLIAANTMVSIVKLSTTYIVTP